MSLEWVVTGIILLGAMFACGIILWIRKRREAQIDSFEAGDISSVDEFKKDEFS